MSLEVLLGILAQLPITPDSCLCVMSLFSTVWGYRLKKICSPQSRNDSYGMSVDEIIYNCMTLKEESYSYGKTINKAPCTQLFHFYTSLMCHMVSFIGRSDLCVYI